MADITASEPRAEAEDEVREDAGAMPDAPTEAGIESLPLAVAADEPAIAMPPPPEEDAELTPKAPARRGWWRRPSL